MPASQGLLRRRSGTPALATASHTALSLARAPARPPSASPAASATALTAPALVALIQPMSSVSSSSRRSSTPQVKAPCAPPPSSARLRRRCRRQKFNNAEPSFARRAPHQGEHPGPIMAAHGAASWQHVERQHNRHAVDHAHSAPRCRRRRQGARASAHPRARRRPPRGRPASARSCDRSARRATGRAAPPPRCGPPRRAR